MVVSYADIGVRPFINCCGARTIHGGSIMLPEAVRAMQAAAGAFVNIDELMAAAGRRIAELTGAEAAIVTCGGSAGLTHATAACVAGADPELMLRLPDTRGMRRRVVMPRGQRFTYDHAIRAVGVDIVEVESVVELERALDGPVAMVALLGSKEAEDALSVEVVARHARPRGVPIVVDAASEHLERPNPHLARGASLVAYSGGKFLRGPQPTGLLLGERSLVEAAWKNSAPHHAFGRMMKVGKEEVMGLLAALEVWAAGGRDPEHESRKWHRDLQTIGRAVEGIATVTTRILPPAGPAERVPRLEIRWDGARMGVGGLDLRRRLLDREPRIMLDDRGATAGSVFILPFSLQPGEAEIVGERLRAELAAAAPEAREPAVAAAAAEIAGDWRLTIAFIRGQSEHELRLRQDGARLTGVHRTAALESTLTGRLEGESIAFESAHPFQGTSLVYRFTGTVADGQMAGAVALGTEGTSAPGPLNRREFGEATWRATRCG